jgi:hypothetical protein
MSSEIRNPAALEVVQSQSRHSAVERSGNATFSLAGWSLRPILYCSQHDDAIHAFLLLQPSGRPLISQRRNRPVTGGSIDASVHAASLPSQCFGPAAHAT